MHDINELTEAFRYLDELRESGSTNMFGAATWLANDYGLEKKDATKILSMWMNTYDDTEPYVRAAEAMETE